MRNIRLEGVSKSLHGDLIIQNLSLQIPGGKFFALLGPSGSGKTTVLRLIAGLEEPDTGRIFLGDRDITHVPPNERRINTVFQHYALFPHMNVFDNVAYGLRLRGEAQDTIEHKVQRILKAMNLEKQVYRSIGRLSGGQQQRVALARAVVNEPEVLLLDEPLAALDQKLRERMLVELIELQEELGTTFVYVTHDQSEALTVADHIAIMNYDGEIEQIDVPKRIYEFPESTFVASFVGTTNIFKGVLSIAKGVTSIQLEGVGSFEVIAQEDQRWLCNGCTIHMGLRPEKIEIAKKKLPGFSNCLQGEVEAIIYHGRSTQYRVRLANGSVMQVFEQNEEHFEQEVIDYDDTVFLHWQKENVVLLER